ncbi:hypothetical protein [Allohahella sp. A8]|uniref:hypothetical protein n=1 Tax=Allohahella sp. A8 TaxID=3141461 RepID=UPI003A80761B
MKLKALLGVGLLLGSMSVNAAYILEMPERVSFDINSDFFGLDYVLDLDRGNPNTWDEFIEFNYQFGGPGLEGVDGLQLGFYGPEEPDLGLHRILTGRPIGPDDNGEMRYFPNGIMEHIQLGVDYYFSVLVTDFLYDLTDCADEGEPPYSCKIINSGLTGGTFVSFYDGGTGVDVPVGPTAPLLAAGLVGLWMRKQKD